MEKQYFLFGAIACRAFDSEGNEEAVTAICQGEGQLFKFDPSNPDNTLDLLGAYSGWDTFLQIPQDDFEEIEEQVQWERVGEWTGAELFEWLQVQQLIDEDEEVEDWLNCRGDMVDMVRDNLDKFYEGD